MTEYNKIDAKNLINNDTGALINTARMIANMLTEMTQGQINEYDNIIIVDVQEMSKGLIEVCWNNSVDYSVRQKHIVYKFDDNSVIKIKLY